MTGRLRAIFARLSRLELFFSIALLVYLTLLLVPVLGTIRSIAGLLLVISGVWLAIRYLRIALRKSLWSLRNRLLATYMFIGVVPVALIVLFVGLGSYILASQVAIYLANSELQRRITYLDYVSSSIVGLDSDQLGQEIDRLGKSFRGVFPQLQLLVENRRNEIRWPGSGTFPQPPSSWSDSTGILFRDGRFYGWSHKVSGATQVTAICPLTRQYLSSLVRGFGEVSFAPPPPIHAGFRLLSPAPETSTIRFPPPVNRFDFDVRWATFLPVIAWDDPKAPAQGFLTVHTRPSILLDTLFSLQSNDQQDRLQIALISIGILFLVVVLVALVIGISLARTITGAVHQLYQGTQRVIEGDFSHRIAVPRNDQVGELTTSFNVMTANVERLLSVAKEKERMQAELEIAREVQAQLFPRIVPDVRSLTLTAVCQPARMVSGDYYDYQCVDGNKLAFAIGDVAGKGISAALLMATVQSAMRTQMRTVMEVAAPSGAVRAAPLSTAHLVSELNQQLYAFTAPEKYATFYFAIYDDANGVLTYTNAGHLPPILVRDGKSVPLDINGTVVGAFPFSLYEESRLQLKSGDLLVCYTDGITEPENEFEEMFGEERMIELIAKHADCEEKKIIDTVMDSVRQWTRAAELPDDMTILLARKN